MKRAKLRREITFVAPKRTQDYYRLRWYWLMELYTIKAKRKYGTATIKDIKMAQKELARIRKEEISV